MRNRAFAGFSRLKNEIIFVTSFETEIFGYASPLVVDGARVPELRLCLWWLKLDSAFAAEILIVSCSHIDLRTVLVVRPCAKTTEFHPS
jgi:hypothetical protein